MPPPTSARGQRVFLVVIAASVSSCSSSPSSLPFGSGGGRNAAMTTPPPFRPSAIRRHRRCKNDGGAACFAPPPSSSDPARRGVVNPPPRRRGSAPRRASVSVSASASALSLAPQQLGEFEPLNACPDGAKRIARRRVALLDFASSTIAVDAVAPPSPADAVASGSTAADTAPEPRPPPSPPSSVRYGDAWKLQKRLVEDQLLRLGTRPGDPPAHDQFLPSPRLAGSGEGDAAAGCDAMIMLEHEPVYTLGTASDPSFIRGYGERGDEDDAPRKEGGVEIVRVERGGEVTYHGPGQLVVYPILDLRGYRQDIHWYMRALEEVVLLALGRVGVEGATREDGITGVWVSGKKIAAVGIRARRWVTMHGLSVNVDRRSLENFGGIVPCGLVGRDVTCVEDELRRKSGGGGQGGAVVTVEDFAACVREALEEVFEVHLVPVPAEGEGEGGGVTEVAATSGDDAKRDPRNGVGA